MVMQNPASVALSNVISSSTALYAIKLHTINFFLQEPFTKTLGSKIANFKNMFANIPQAETKKVMFISITFENGTGNRFGLKYICRQQYIFLTNYFET